MMKVFFLAALLIFCHLLFLLNLQYTSWPEMLSYPYLLSKGFSLYKDIALPYQPILPVLQSVIFNLFGFNLLTLKILTWVIILISDLLILYISLKTLGAKLLSLIPLTLYVFLQLLTSGNMLWFDLATVPFILLALLSFLFLKNFSRWFLLGLFLGVAVFIKQQAAVVFVPLAIYLFVAKQKINFFHLLLGVLIPAFFVALFILSQNLMYDFWFWTVNVPLNWYPKFPGYTRMPTVVEITFLLLIFVPGFYLSIRNIKKFNEQTGIVFLVFMALFLTSFPRFDFFRMQPALAVYIILLILLLSKKSKHIFPLIIPIILAVMLLIKSNLPLVGSPARFYGPDDLKMIEEVKRLSSGQDKIYILGASSLIYVLSDRLPPKPWVDNYVWYMEIPGIQESVISGLEKEKVRFIFWKEPTDGQWFELGSYQPRKITDYIASHYQKEDNLEGDIEVWIRKD